MLNEFGEIAKMDKISRDKRESGICSWNSLAESIRKMDGKEIVGETKRRS
jgi:hypothetical protein